SGGKPWRPLAEHALEPEHEPVPDPPARRGNVLVRVDLGERIVERPPPGSPRRERDGRVLTFAKERLDRPLRRANGSLAEAVLGLQHAGRVLGGLLHPCSTPCA